MTEQTEAQRLADELIALHGYPLSIKAAAELRRLDAELERFAAAARAAERNKLAAWMIAQGYATGHGDTMEQLLEELVKEKNT